MWGYMRKVHGSSVELPSHVDSDAHGWTLPKNEGVSTPNGERVKPVRGYPMCVFVFEAKERNRETANPTIRLSDRKETVDGGTLTLSTVTGGDVGHGELAKVVTDHLGLDLGVDEETTGVDSDHGADHLGDDDHVTKVGLDGGGLLVGGSLGLGLAETLDETHGLALQTALELSAGTGVDELHEVLVGHVEESIELDTTVGELAESSLALELGSGGGVVVIPASEINTMVSV